MNKFKQFFGPFLGGVIFAVGLSLSGMTNPKKISGFLNLFGNWDPSLLFVMGGALLINIILTKFILIKESPLFTEQFHIPTRKDIDTKLITGALIFGVGWGISGLCPGPAITALVTGQKYVYVFFVPMIIGMLVVKYSSKWLK